MRPEDRLDAIEALLDEMRVQNANTPILVEGRRDRAALEALGCAGHIVVINDGRSTHGTAEELARSHDRVILLSDWDRTGGALARGFRQAFETLGVTCDDTFRRDLARLTSKETKAVEAIPGVVARLRARLGRR